MKYKGVRGLCSLKTFFKCVKAYILVILFALEDKYTVFERTNRNLSVANKNLAGRRYVPHALQTGRL